MIACDFNTLLIVVDVNRPGYVESAALLESINKIAVIDHHRRAADYICLLYTSKQLLQDC